MRQNAQRQAQIGIARRNKNDSPRTRRLVTAMQTATYSRRLVERYTVQLITAFSWVTPGNQVQAAEGVTRDVSSSGLFIMASTAPPLNSQMRFEIHLPEIGTTAPELRICGEGEVCRVEMSDGAKGFAIRNSTKLRVNRLHRKHWVV
jgi:hypothetical protein